MIKLRHERMLILRCIFPQKKLNYLQKKNYPPPPRPPPEKSRTPWQETQVTGNILSFWKISASPPPPSPKKIRKIWIYKKNENTSLLVKVSTTLKLPKPLWKSFKPPTWKILNFSKNPITPSVKFSTPLK